MKQTSELLLDTHVWYWLVTGDDRLSKETQLRIQEAAVKEQLRLAAISIWEIAMLTAKGKIVLKQPCMEWITSAIEMSSIRVAEPSISIWVESCYLPANDNADPADRLIIATARHLNATLVTADRKILAYGDKGHFKALKAD